MKNIYKENTKKKEEGTLLFQVHQKEKETKPNPNPSTSNVTWSRELCTHKEIKVKTKA